MDGSMICGLPCCLKFMLMLPMSFIICLTHEAYQYVADYQTELLPQVLSDNFDLLTLQTLHLWNVLLGHSAVVMHFVADLEAWLL